MSNCDNPIRLVANSCMNDGVVICILYPFIMYLFSSPTVSCWQSPTIPLQQRHNVATMLPSAVYLGFL